MTHSIQPLCDAIVDTSAFSMIRTRLTASPQAELSIFSANFLGDQDILREIRSAEEDFLRNRLDSCERGLLCLQLHLECLFPGNKAGLACIFFCLGLVKQRQKLFYHSFGYLLHALSVLEQSVGSVNVPAVLILNAIHNLELERNEFDRADDARMLARLVEQRLGTQVHEARSIWEYLRQEQHAIPPTLPAASIQLDQCYKDFRTAVRSYGVASMEAGTAAMRLGAALYSERQLVEARKYLERGVSVSRHSKNVDLRNIADIYDLLTTICEELNDPPASDRFRACSRTLRMCVSLCPGMQGV